MLLFQVFGGIQAQDGVSILLLRMFGWRLVRQTALYNAATWPQWPTWEIEPRHWELFPAINAHNEFNTVVPMKKPERQKRIDKHPNVRKLQVVRILGVGLGPSDRFATQQLCLKKTLWIGSFQKQMPKNCQLVLVIILKQINFKKVIHGSFVCLLFLVGFNVLHIA